MKFRKPWECEYHQYQVKQCRVEQPRTRKECTIPPIRKTHYKTTRRHRMGNHCRKRQIIRRGRGFLFLSFSYFFSGFPSVFPSFSRCFLFVSSFKNKKNLSLGRGGVPLVRSWAHTRVSFPPTRPNFVGEELPLKFLGEKGPPNTPSFLNMSAPKKKARISRRAEWTWTARRRSRRPCATHLIEVRRGGYHGSCSLHVAFRPYFPCRTNCFGAQR